MVLNWLLQQGFVQHRSEGPLNPLIMLQFGCVQKLLQYPASASWGNHWTHSDVGSRHVRAGIANQCSCLVSPIGIESKLFAQRRSVRLSTQTASRAEA